MENQKLLPVLSLSLGLAGVILMLADVLGVTYQWQLSAAAILSSLASFAVGGPILLAVFLTGSTANATSLDYLLLIGYVLSFICTLALARSLGRRMNRWGLLGFLSPFIPPIILAAIASREEPSQAAGPSRSLPAAAAAPASTPGAAPLSRSQIHQLAETILNSSSFGMEQIRARDELRAHQQEPGVKEFFTQALEQEPDADRRIKIVKLLGSFPVGWAITLLNEAAANDPHTATADEYYPSSDPDVEEMRSHVTIWPVREAAEKAVKGSGR
ncbi:MAG: hypothetical protein JXB15_06520 [Anaerolineales bacterium]|nr:hypothetical protein [Anaerolineales bacterium]